MQDVPMPDGHAHAIAVMPPLGGRGTAAPVRRWLSRSRLSKQALPASDLDRVLSLLSMPPAECPAALRLWGQTGERPSVWVAAADPAYLEARLDHVHLHALPAADLPRADLQRLFDDLQQTLCAGTANGLARVGKVGYLRGEAAMATATLPPALVDGQRIDDYLPTGDDAAPYLAMTGEIQMSLHAHPVNAEREAAGRQPVNTLWIWGGGYAPHASSGTALPPLMSDEPLLRGYWHAAGGSVSGQPGSGDLSGSNLANGVVLTLPDDVTDPDLTELLEALRHLQQGGVLRTVTLACRDGVVATVRRSDRLRFWRSSARTLFGTSS